MSTKKLQILGSLGDKIYKQNEAPTDAEEGALWLDLDSDGKGSGGVSSWNDLTDRPFGSEREIVEFTYEENENNIILESGKTIYYVTSSVLNRYDNRDKLLSVEYAGGDAGAHIPEYTVDTENANCIWATDADENEVCVYQYEINMRNETEGTDVISLFSFDANDEGATLPVTFEYEEETIALKESGMYLAGIRMEFAVFDSLFYEEIHEIDEKYLPEIEVSAPDWSDNDESSSGYIYNRTHYETIEEVVTIEPYGWYNENNIDGGSFHDWETLYYVSESTPPEPAVNAVKIEYANSYTIVSPYDNLLENENGWVGYGLHCVAQDVDYASFYVYVIYEDNTQFEFDESTIITFPKAGIYSTMYEAYIDDESTDVHIEALYNVTVKQLDEKFISEDIIRRDELDNRVNNIYWGGIKDIPFYYNEISNRYFNYPDVVTTQSCIIYKSDAYIDPIEENKLMVKIKLFNGIDDYYDEEEDTRGRGYYTENYKLSKAVKDIIKAMDEDGNEISIYVYTIHGYNSEINEEYELVIFNIPEWFGLNYVFNYNDETITFDDEGVYVKLEAEYENCNAYIENLFIEEVKMIDKKFIPECEVLIDKNGDTITSSGYTEFDYMVDAIKNRTCTSFSCWVNIDGVFNAVQQFTYDEENNVIKLAPYGYSLDTKYFVWNEYGEVTLVNTTE